MSGVDPRAEWFAGQRAYLFAVAYRMLGVAQDAEDVVQDAWLRFAGVELAEVRDVRGWLVTAVTRLAIDALRSARKQREEYVGLWLPEPVPTAEALPDELLEQAESTSLAFLLLLERLTPNQRAALVLFDVLDHTHEEVAQTLGKSPAACRQLLRRARAALAQPVGPKRLTGAAAAAQAERFAAATRAGELDAILATLAPDAVLVSDGGGKVAAVRRPVVGAHRVAHFLAAVRKLGTWSPFVVTELNGQPALLVGIDGRLQNAYVFDTSAAGITALYVMRNPAKLARLKAYGVATQ